MTDYYKVLGVPKTATADEIKKAYRKLAKQYHPDATGGNKAAEQQFIKINEAYDTLGNEKKRKEYDAARENPFANGGNPFSRGSNPFSGGGTSGQWTYRNINVDDLGDLGDLFGNLGGMFGRGARGFGGAQPQHSLDVEAKCEIPPWIAALGGKIDVRVSDKTLSVKVPMGARSGQKLRLRGQGLSAQGRTGDLLIEIVIQNPKTLSPAQRELYERLART